MFNTLSYTFSWTNTNTAGVFRIWLFKHHWSNSTLFFLGDRPQDRTSQFSSLCSGLCLCQLQQRTLHSLRTCHAFLKEQCTEIHFGFTLQFRWESIEPGLVLLLQPDVRKMTHVTKSTTGSDSTVESSPAGDVRVNSDENEVKSFITWAELLSLILLKAYLSYFGSMIFAFTFSKGRLVMFEHAKAPEAHSVVGGFFCLFWGFFAERLFFNCPLVEFRH